ncbi:type II secretion system protein GspL [Marinomonas algicola]|uniref:type II secretion system protein GspL n=1 Tax=Marinomonas algicola TaxID=2773454 RepID=UPI001749C461|nr:type II secretion system protein GspL [Marinomonas algicola]
MNRLIIRCYELSTLGNGNENNYSSESESLLQFGSLASYGDWALVDDKGAFLEYQTNADLSALAEYLSEKWVSKGMKYTDVIVCPPTERLHTRCLSLEVGQRKHLEKVAPFLMEEALAQSMDELHFTLFDKSQQDSAWVVAVDKSLLSLWIEQLASWQFPTPAILSMACGFMEQAKQNETNTLLVKTHQTGDKEGHTNDRSVSAPNWLWINESSVIMLPDSILPHLPENAMESAIVDTEAEKTVLECLAQFVINTRNWQEKNLCHGAFRLGGLWLEKLTAWRWVAAFAIVAFCLELFLMQASTKALALQEQEIKQQANSLFLELAPNEGRVVNLSRQLRGLLQQKPDHQAVSDANTPYDVLAKIDQARDEVEGVHRLTQLDFFDQTYRLDWQAQKRDTLDAIQSALEKSALSVQIEQVVRQDAGYRAALKIQLTK